MIRRLRSPLNAVLSLYGRGRRRPAMRRPVRRRAPIRRRRMGRGFFDSVGSAFKSFGNSVGNLATRGFNSVKNYVKDNYKKPSFYTGIAGKIIPGPVGTALSVGSTGLKLAGQGRRRRRPVMRRRRPLARRRVGGRYVVSM